MRRFDSFNSSKMKTNNAGMLVLDGIVSSVGVFQYLDKNNEIIRELRHPDDVFNYLSMQTLKGLPVTHNHPVNKDGSYIEVDFNNSKNFTIGLLGDELEIEKDSYIKGKITFIDSKIGDLIAGNEVQISPSYHCEVVPEVGVYNGEEYTHRQKNIRYNHISILKLGRQGSEVSLKLDCDDRKNINLNSGGEKEMHKDITINGKTYKVDADLSQEILFLMRKEKDLIEEKTKLQAKIDVISKETKNDNAINPDKIIELMKERDQVLDKASAFLEGEELKKHRYDAPMVIIDMCLKADGQDLSDKDDVYKNAYFDIAYESRIKNIGDKNTSNLNKAFKHDAKNKKDYSKSDQSNYHVKRYRELK